ncbi:MAG: hypothetical protein AB1656_12420 [Candidatus Omnitrophota bacterium]
MKETSDHKTRVDLLAKAIAYLQDSGKQTLITFVCADAAKANALQKFIKQGFQKKGIPFSANRMQFLPAYRDFQEEKTRQQEI